jgi:hypothetical protein
VISELIDVAPQINYSACLILLVAAVSLTAG